MAIFNDDIISVQRAPNSTRQHSAGKPTIVVGENMPYGNHSPKEMTLKFLIFTHNGFIMIDIKSRNYIINKI